MSGANSRCRGAMLYIMSDVNPVVRSKELVLNNMIV